MNIALAVHHFPPRHNGGSENQTFLLASELHNRGNRVRVFCVDRIDPGQLVDVIWKDDVYQGIPVRRLSLSPRASFDSFQYTYDNPLIGEHLQTWLTAEPTDVFHLISGYLLSGRALRVAHELSIPTVVSLMDFWFLCPRISMLKSNGIRCALPIQPAQCAQCLGEEQRRFRWPGRLLPDLMAHYWSRQDPAIQRVEERLNFLFECLAETDRIICNSQFLRSTFIESGLPPKQIVFIRQGIDPFSGEERAQPKPAGKQASLQIGYIGQIAAVKGIHVLFEAAGRLPGLPIHVRAFGNTDAFPRYSARLKRMAARDPRLELAGVYHGKEEAAQVLRSFDVLVVPSLWSENSPNVILEAFAQQLPVITSNLGGMAELVNDGVNGLLFEPGNSQDLANQISRLLLEPDLLPALRSGMGPVKSVVQEAEEVETNYQELIGARHLMDLQ
jgi:glycosyltransferase involved in cell wall biosynthesis